jgi:transposase-like protein
MVEFWFTPRSNFTIHPHKWTYRLSLAHIDGWRNLDHVVQMALVRGSYNQEYSGIAHCHDKAHSRQMRFWRTQWTDKTGPHGKIRHFHFPEVDYLATLSARLLAAGQDDDAARVRAMALAPLPSVTLLPAPDPYELSNYSFNQEFTHEVRHSVRLILDQRDFVLAQERATRREGYTVADGSRLEYLAAGQIRLHLQRGHTQEVAEALYRDLVARLPLEVEKWTASH